MPFACFKNYIYESCIFLLQLFISILQKEKRKKSCQTNFVLISLFNHITSLRKNRPNASEDFKMFSGYSSGSPVLTAIADPHIHRSHG